MFFLTKCRIDGLPGLGPGRPGRLAGREGSRGEDGRQVKELVYQRLELAGVLEGPGVALVVVGDVVPVVGDFGSAKPVHWGIGALWSRFC